MTIKGKGVYIRMPNRMITIDSNIQSTRSLEAKRPTSLEKHTGADIRACDLICNGIGHRIFGCRVALWRVEENVLATHVVKRRCFDVWTVGYLVVVGENLEYSSDHAEAIVHIDLLYEERWV
jgi:hypothetical protein